MKNHLLEKKILDRLEAVLREEGFADLELHSSPSSWTLSADKGAVRVVAHLEDQNAPPTPHSGLNLKVARSSERRETVSLQGVATEPGGSLVAGGGGGPSGDPR